jgi:hypothetical protein
MFIRLRAIDQVNHYAGISRSHIWKAHYEDVTLIAGGVASMSCCIVSFDRGRLAVLFVALEKPPIV